MQKVELPELITLSGKLKHFAAESWFDDACIDMDYFIKTLEGMKAEEAQPDLIGSIIARYASKWLPELSEDEAERAIANSASSPQTATASWMKKKFLTETLIKILPPEKDSVPCNFLLRLLRIAKMVRAEPGCCTELEKHVAWQLDQASLGELMIPSFSHNCATLLDVELVLRLVQRFLSMEDFTRTGTTVFKVAKLVDSYLAEAAVDSHLTAAEFVAIASVLPVHARSTDDGLYRAIDMYLKAHPGLSKQERKTLWSLLDSRKLSQEASLHAAQNERLPVRAVIQVLLSEQNKLHKHIDWSGSLSGTKSPARLGLEHPAQCFSKRETGLQLTEIQRLKEDMLRLQCQCMTMERQIEKLLEKKRGCLSWKRSIVQCLRPRK